MARLRMYGISYLSALTRAFAIFILTVACLGLAILGTILIPTDGTEPRGVCVFVDGDEGLLPLNPNTDDTYVYSCDLNWELGVFYVSVFGSQATVALFVLVILVHGIVSATRRRSRSRKDE